MPGRDMPVAAEAGTADVDLAAALRSPNAFVISDVGTVTMQQAELPMDLEATGLLAYDPRDRRSVTARVAGWIEDLQVNYRYQLVRKGQPLMKIYSKELVTEQENYLFLRKQETEGSGVLKAAEQRLEYIGLTKEQIAALRSNGKVLRTVTIHSPYTGHLHENDGGSEMDPSPSASAPGSMPMAGSSGKELSLREGGYVEKGRTLFTIYGTSTVLARLSVHPGDGQDRIAVGQAVSLRIDGSAGPAIEGHVDLIEPVYRERTNLVSVRVYIPNPDDQLRIGTRVTAAIHVAPRSAWVLPIDAVVSTGSQQYVFVKEPGGFRSRLIATGVRSGERIEVLSGITQLDRLAQNAQLLIDSEGFIKATAP